MKFQNREIRNAHSLWNHNTKGGAEDRCAMAAGCDAGINVDAAMIQVDTPPAEMGGTGNAPESKPQLSKAERECRDMIRRSCDRRMN